MSYGDTVLLCGVLLTGASIIALIVGNIVFSVKKKNLKNTLVDKYGF